MSDEALLKRIDAKLTHLINKPAKEHWVGVEIIQKITKWDSKGMEKARNNGLVKFKDNGKRGYLYLLESIPEMFIITNSIS